MRLVAQLSCTFTVLYCHKLLQNATFMQLICSEVGQSHLGCLFLVFLPVSNRFPTNSFCANFELLLELDMIGYACKQKVANCIACSLWVSNPSQCFILRTNCMHTNHQQTTATQWWHMEAHCMHVIRQQIKSKGHAVIYYQTAHMQIKCKTACYFIAVKLHACTMCARLCHCFALILEHCTHVNCKLCIQSALKIFIRVLSSHRGVVVVAIFRDLL